MAYRRLQQRPADFRLDPRSPLHEGLVFAGLGRAPGTFTYFDSSPSCNDGTLNGYSGAGDTPADRWQYAPPLGRWSLSLDGGTRQMSAIASGLPVYATDAFTIAFWHNTPAVVSLANLFGFGDILPTNGGGGTERYIITYLGHYYFWGSNADWDTGIAVDADETWHHIAFTFDGAYLQFYRDGVPSAGPSASPGFGTTSIHITIGGGHSVAASSLFSTVADPLIFSRTLSAAEIAALADPSNADLRVGSGSDPLILPVTRGRSFLSLFGSGGGPAPSSAALTASLDALTATLAATASAPASSSGTLSASLASLTTSLVATAAAPSGSSAALTAALASLTATAAATASAPASASGALTTTLEGLTVTATATAGAPGTTLASLTASLAALVAAGSLSATVPPGSTGTLAGSLASLAGSLAGSAAAPGTITASLVTTLGPLTISATATAGVAGATTASLTAALDGLTTTATATPTAPLSCSAVLTAALAPVAGFFTGSIFAAGGLSPSLFAAVKDRFAAAGLEALAPGGLWHVRAKSGTAAPFVTVMLKVQFSELVTASIQVDRARITFTVVHTSLPAATTLARSVAAAFVGQSLAWAAGHTAPWRQQGVRPDEFGRLAPSGLQLHAVAVEFDARLSGSP